MLKSPEEEESASTATVPEPAGSPWVMEIEGLRHELLNRRSGDHYAVNVDRLVFPKESFICILGESGCGKTTLLTLIGLARRPERPLSGGEATARFVIRETLDGERSNESDIAQLWSTGSGRRRIEHLRRRLLGFALQSGELLPTLTVEENVGMPLRLNGWKRKESSKRVRELLDRLSPPVVATAVGTKAKESLLWERRRYLPADLSGGQYQRVALARALAHKPRLLFVDEPTGNLDSVTARQALDLLNELRVDSKTTVVMITHDELLARDYAQYIVRMGVVGDKTGGIVGFEERVDGEWRTVAEFSVDHSPAAQPQTSIPTLPSIPAEAEAASQTPPTTPEPLTVADAAEPTTTAAEPTIPEPLTVADDAEPTTPEPLTVADADSAAPAFTSSNESFTSSSEPHSQRGAL